jgi:GNAT superfamily N-acetyltransferase
MLSFRTDVPLETTMDFELVYHPNLQMDLASKKFLRQIPGAIFLWMYIDGSLAGETYGIPLAASDENLPGLSELPPDEKQTAFYCYSNTLLPAYQHQGFGALLKTEWLARVTAAGYKSVYGHARPGPSQELNASFGAVFSRSFPNWYGTGETYAFYRLALDGVARNK